MQSIKNIKWRYYWQLFFYAIFVIGSIVALILLVVYRNTFSDEIIMTYILIVIFAIIEIGCLLTLIIYLKDLKSVLNNNFEEITGTVIRYKRNQDPESGQQMNTLAIVRIIDCNKEIEIHITEGTTKRNGTYNFIYLKHTKIGAVKSKII